MGYDAFLAAASAAEAAGRLEGRNLIDLRILFGRDLLLVFGPRREPAFAVMATEPSPAFYVVPDRRAGELQSAGDGLPPLGGLESFVRLLEARLAGRPLAAARPYPWERTVRLAFGPREGLRGTREPAFLVHEAAPKPARIIVLGPDRAVVAAWPPPGGHTEGADQTARYRSGVPYEPPARPWAKTPDELAADRPAFEAALAAAERESLASGAESPPWRLVLAAAPALGPEHAKEVARRARPGDDQGLFEAFTEVVVGYRTVPADSVGEGVSAWQIWSRTHALAEGLRARLARAVRSALARAERKVGRQAEDVSRFGEAADLRRQGEMLVANLHLVEPGRSEVTVPDYEGNEVTIALDPRLAPSQNAQRFFQRYRRAQRAAKATAPREKAAYELAWLEGQAYDLERVAEQDLAAEPAGEPDPGGSDLDRVWARVTRAVSAIGELRAIEASLAGAGYLPSGARPKATTPGAQAPATPLRFVTDDGLTVLAGRSARQNETLSLKTAQPSDLWFHARGCPGSHVVLRVPPGSAPEAVPDGAVLQAAALAAHLSAARGGGKVAVDYTEARHLRRPGGAPPGLVLYDPHRTVLIDTARVSLPRKADG